MLIYEAKLEGTQNQYVKLDEAIRTGRFVRNSIIKAWCDGHVKSRNDAYSYCKTLADNPEFPWAKKLNSMARQAHAERAWASIERFYANCKSKKPGKKGFPKFKKYQTKDSVEYKTSGYKLSDDRRYITFTDGFKAGTFKLWGTRNLHYYQLSQIKRVRIVRKADGYYVQFVIDYTREINKELTGKQLGLDVGLNHFYTDSDGNQVDNPRFLRKDERKIKKLQRRLSRKKKGSSNRKKAINKLGRAHLRVSRRRNDFACQLARRVIQSADLVAIENLKIRNMIKNRHLAKSISDVAWYRFREWLEYFGRIYGVPVIAVEPKMTSQNCSNCNKVVQKTLSTRTHVCPHCGYQADRDENAARNILKLGLKQLVKDTDGQSGINNASQENPLCLNVETHSSKGTRRKRKLSQ